MDADGLILIEEAIWIYVNPPRWMWLVEARRKLR
jgi:hypothetical protein